MENAATDSRQAILDAAESILIRTGYAGLSMRALSAQSNLAKSTLYHYFTDKQQIYLSVLERDMQTTQRELEAAAAVPGEAVVRLSNVIVIYMKALNRRGSVALNALRRAGELDRQLMELFDRYRPRLVEPISAVIRQGMSEGVFRAVDADLTVLSLLVMLNGFAAHRLLFECNDDTTFVIDHQMIEHTVNLFLHGLCAH